GIDRHDAPAPLRARPLGEGVCDSPHSDCRRLSVRARIVVNPKWFLSLPMPDQVFVLAHEVLHLALRTHERCEGSDARLFNIAHDYIINDMLRESLDCPVPAQGLDMPGAAKRSAEEIVADLKANAGGTGLEAWGGARMGSLGEALARAGAVKLVENSQRRFPLLDALDASIERQ